MSLGRIRTNLHAQYCKARQFHYLVESEDFGLVFESATPNKQKYVRTLVRLGDMTNIKKFIREELLKLTPFHQMSIRQLRQMGQRLRVRGYNTLHKGTLVQEIQHAVERVKESSQRIPYQPQQTGTTQDSC